MPTMNELPSDFKIQVWNLEQELTRSEIEKIQQNIKGYLLDIWNSVDNMSIGLDTIEWLVKLELSLANLELPK